jgi:multiple sugar transport system permease protein
MSSVAPAAAPSPQAGESVGMSYLETPSRKFVTIYLPLLVFLFVLLFPFYWMGSPSVKPDAELLSRTGNPFWVITPTLAHFNKLLFHTSYPQWMWNTVLVSVVATFVSLVCSVFAAYAIERLRFNGSKQVGPVDLPRLPGAAVDPVHSAGAIVYQLGLFDTRWALILTYPDLPYPVLDLAADGLLPLDSVRARGMRPDRRRQPLADPDQDRPAAGGAGLISAGIFAFTLSWNEFIYALTFVSSSEVKTVPVGVVTELVEGDVYHWGPLMAGACSARCRWPSSTRSSSSTTCRA